MKHLNKALLFVFTLTLYSQNFVKDLSNVVNQANLPSNYSGSAFVDIDGDGDQDIYSSLRFFFINDGNGNFILEERDIDQQSGGISNGVSFADIDNDGDIDLALAGSPSALYYNENSTLSLSADSPVSLENKNYGWAAAWGDYDNDGFVDLIITNPKGFLTLAQPCFLFKNNGDGRFTKIEDYEFNKELAPYTIPTWTDYDLDGDLDLFIGSGPAGTAARDFNYRNMLIETGSVDFVRIDDDPIGSDLQDGQTYNFIDFDNDMDLDIFLTNYGGAPDRFYVNHNGTYESVQNSLTIDGNNLANTWGDFDNDSFIDVIVTSENTTYYYQNNGDGSFSQKSNSITSNGAGRGAISADIDNDGDLDVFIGGASSVRGLYRNDLDNNNSWVKFNLEGTISNKSAIGSKVKIKAVINGKETWQIREINSQNSFNSHNSYEVHFGLSDAAVISQAIIEFPSGQKETLENISVNKTYDIVEEIPNDFLNPNFKGDVIEGFGSVEVQFTDLSIAGTNNQITKWEWDFNNDGITDSEEQNPKWTFNQVGKHTVTLTLYSNSIFDKLVREDYVEVKIQPGIPVVIEKYPMNQDTAISKSGSVDFRVAAKDTTGYNISYIWFKNNVQVGSDSTYNYKSFILFPAPRVDTVLVKISNSVNTKEEIWYVHVETTTGIEDQVKPINFGLQQNYPNPFNPSTIIEYSVPSNEYVTLKVYDILGNEVASLVNEQKSAGTYKVAFNASNLSNGKADLASGLYIYKIQAGSFNQVRKMILIK